MKITFYGGTGMVTGSNFLLEDTDLKILVDCGLAQGGRDMEAKNWEKFLYEPASINFLVITHAHIDHIGRIPKLVREGFRGKIISTEATRELALPMLQDSASLLKHAAEKYNREILYDKQNIEEALRLWQGIAYHETFSLPNDIFLEFLNAGHILGSAMAEFSRNGKKIIFTGDLGGHSDLLAPAESPEGVSYLVMESVYGDRTHDESVDRRQALQKIIADTAERGGTLLIPAFSTERTQDLLFDVRKLMMEKLIPSVPVFLDSPLAEKMTAAFLKNPEYFKKEIAEKIEQGENIFSFPELKFIDTQEQSRRIAATDPAIIIAGSGMSSGGRVLAHEKEILPDANSAVCIVGYQSAGSIGRRLLDGEKSLDIMGERVPVRAKIEHIFSYSAHMDSPELVAFAEKASASVQKIFVVMGEPASSVFLAQRIRAQLGLDANVPSAGESVEIEM